MLRNLTIIKRDGREVPFSKDKIVSAALGGQGGLSPLQDASG